MLAKIKNVQSGCPDFFRRKHPALRIIKKLGASLSTHENSKLTEIAK
jgi:hypothetical protein